MQKLIVQVSGHAHFNQLYLFNGYSLLISGLIFTCRVMDSEMKWLIKYYVLNSYLFATLSRSITQTMTDDEAIDQYLVNRNQRYFDILYHRYSSKIFGKCISILKDEEKAADATQEIFMKILMNLSKFNKKAKFSTWIYSITYNYCIDFIRKRKKDKSILVEDLANEYDTAEDDIEDQFLLDLNVKRLKVILNRISLSDKTILLMKYQDEMSIREISQIIIKSESAIKMSIKRAKLRFQKEYQENYMTC